MATSSLTASANQSVVIPTLKEMMHNVRNLKQAIQEEYDFGKAKKVADALYDDGILATQKFSPYPGKAENFPFPVAFHLVELLSLEELQFADDLKYSLSKTCRVFMDIVLFKCAMEKRSIFLSTKENSIVNFDPVIKSLPHPEVVPEAAIATRLELECISGALRAFKAVDAWKSYFLGLGDAVSNQSKWEALKVLGRMWKNEHQAGDWFPVSHSWRLIAPRIKDAQDLEDTKETFQEEFPEYVKKGGWYSLSICEIQMGLIQSTETTKEVKQNAFKARDVGLLRLAERGDDVKGEFWETRHRALEHLKTLSFNPEYAPECINVFLQKIWRAGEKNGCINRLLKKAFRETCSDSATKNIWAQSIHDYNEANPDTPVNSKEVKARKVRVAKEANELKPKLEEKKKELLSEEKNIELLSLVEKKLKAIPGLQSADEHKVKKILDAALKGEVLDLDASEFVKELKSQRGEDELTLDDFLEGLPKMKQEPQRKIQVCKEEIEAIALEQVFLDSYSEVLSEFSEFLVLKEHS